MANNLDNYEPLEVIGSGSFGMIRKVRRKSDGKILARKEIDYRKMTDKEKRQLVAEVNILRELRHPNIVRYYERIVDKDNCMIYIIMEYCEGGDLASVIKRCKKEGKFLTEEAVWVLFTQLLLALHECHHGRTGRIEAPNPVAVLHRDIKPDNVFLDADRNIKLGDFGLSRTLGTEADFAKTFVGTPFYMSPELINESSYNIKSDIWALGCLMYELCALEPPFQAKTQASLAARIKAGKVPPLPTQYSSQLYEMIRSMLHINPSRRPTTADFFKVEKIQRCVEKLEVMNYHADVKRLAEDVKRRETTIESRETALAQKEASLAAREAALQTKTDELRHREATVVEQERKLADKRALSMPTTNYEKRSFEDRSIYSTANQLTNGNHHSAPTTSTTPTPTIPVQSSSATVISGPSGPTIRTPSRKRSQVRLSTSGQREKELTALGKAMASIQLHNQQAAAAAQQQQQQANGYASAGPNHLISNANGVTPTSSSSPAVMMTQQPQPEQYRQRHSTEVSRETPSPFARKHASAIATQGL